MICQFLKIFSNVPMDVSQILDKNEPYLELLSISEVPNKLKTNIILLGPERLTHCLCSCLLNAVAETLPISKKLKVGIVSNKQEIGKVLKNNSAKYLKKHK